MHFIKNHPKIEEIPRGHVESQIEKELQKFQSAKKHISQQQVEGKLQSQEFFLNLEKANLQSTEKNQKNILVM